VILADYGNDSAHEVVALRSAGIPVVIGVDVKTLQQLKSGTQIILDGDSNTVLTSDAKEPTAIHDWIHDASYGINISALKQQVKGPYLMQDGILSAEATLDRMKTLYLNANEEYLRTRESASQVEIFIANLKQHFFHELYLDALRRAS